MAQVGPHADVVDGHRGPWLLALPREHVLPLKLLRCRHAGRAAQRHENTKRRGNGEDDLPSAWQGRPPGMSLCRNKHVGHLQIFRSVL